MNQQVRTYMGNTVVLLGFLLLIPATVITGFVLLSGLSSGAWGLGHTGPLLLIGVPMLLGALAIVLIGLKVKKG
jgi:hypothetical protein